MIARAYTLFITFLLLVGTAIVFYLSWLPNPELSRYGFLPDWLARWTDAEVNDNLRTAVPFVFLGILTGFWLAVAQRGWRWWVLAWLGLTGICLLAELGQLILPLRNFDWGDVTWGALGALSGLASIGICSTVIKWIKGLHA